MVSLTSGYFKTNLIQKGYALTNIHGDHDRSGYQGIEVKKIHPNKRNYFKVILSGNHGCCGEVSISSFDLHYNDDTLTDFNKTCFKEVLREILSQSNNIVSYLTATGFDQVYYAKLLKDVGFKPVFECINKNSGNLCTVWMADLSTLNLS